MVKLTGYEIRKLFKYKLVLLLLLVGTLLVALMMLESMTFKEYGWIRLDREAYQRYIEATYDMPFDEAVEWLQTERNGEMKLLLEFKTMEYTIRPNILNMVRDRYSYVETYDDTIQQVLKQAKQIQTSGFYKDDSFALSDAGKVLEDYSKLTDLPVSRDAALFVEAVAAFDTTDYILLFQLILLTILVFGAEDDNLKRLLRVQNKGRSHVFFAKLAALMCVSTILVFLTYIYLMIVGFVYYGKGALDVPVQSFESFAGSKYLITAGEFMVLLPLFKLIGAWVFVFMFSLCIILAGNVFGSVLSISVTGLFYAAYFTLDGRKLLSPLKYINPAAWFDVNRWISEYANINLFTKAVPFEAAFVTGVVILSVVLVLISRYFYVREVGRKRLVISAKFVEMSGVVREKLTGRASLVFHEIYRLLAEGYRWVFLTVFVMVGALVADSIVNVEIYGNNTYRYYLESINPEYSGETIEYLKKYFYYLMEFDGYRDGIEADYAVGNISEEEYELAVGKLEADIQTLESFKILYDQGQNLKMQNELGVQNLGFIDKKWTDSILMNGDSMVLLELMFVCVMFVVFGGYLTSDHNVFNLVKSTYRGRWENQWMKIANLFVLSLVIVFMPLAVYYDDAFKGLSDTSALDFGIRSIDMYSFCGMDITVKEMFAVSIFFKYVGLVFIGLFMYFLSLYHLPKPVFQIIVLFVTVMPPAIEVMSSQTNFFVFSGFFYMEQLFKQGAGHVIMYTVAVCVFMAVFGVLAVRRYKGKQWTGRRSCNGQRA